MTSQQLINIIIKAEDQASAAAKKVDDSLQKIGKSSSLLSKVPGFDSLKNKMSDVANSIDNRFGGVITKARNKFNTFRNTVTNVGSTIKTKFGGAIDGVRNKLTSFSNKTKGMSSSLGFLRGALSMTVGMIGFDLVNGLVQAGRAAINASSQLDYFGKRLQSASGQSKLSAAEFKKFKGELGELQKEFRKVDMTAVGASAEEMALKMNLPANKLSDLTRMTAVMSSTFVKEGRTQEDAILAVSDAMDGQFKRLQEIGISQDELIKNGWSGELSDQAGLIDALNKTMKDMGYEQTAKDITTLDEAFTALSIAGGQLLSSVLIPITPALVGLINALISAGDMIKGAWDALPDWGKIGIGIGALAIAIGILVPALGALELASLPLVGTLGAIAGAVAAISLPVVAAVAAIGLLVVAIYEIGKSFGWWKDVGSMFDAIKAGVMRLWNAFINHPDVQATIKAITDAWNWLVPAISGVVDKIKEFFNINESGSFDAVKAIIDGIGLAWQALTLPIRTVITIVQTLISVFTQLSNGQLSVSGAIMSIWSGLATNLTPIFTMIGGLILQFAAMVVSYAIRIGSQFVNGIITYVTTLPLKMLAILNLVKTYIIAQATLWVNKAREKARQMVNGVITFVKQLPGRVASYLSQVAHRIVSAGSRWFSSARTAASKIVTGAVGAVKGLPGRIASALSGVVNAVVAPFRSAYEKAKVYYDKIKNLNPLGGGAAGWELGEYGAAGFELTDEIPTVSVNKTNNDSNVEAVQVQASNVDSNIKVIHSGEMTVIHDLKNLPKGVSAEDVARYVNQTVTSDEFGKAIAQNNSFQNWDLKIKQRLKAREYRVRGV